MSDDIVEIKPGIGPIKINVVAAYRWLARKKAKPERLADKKLLPSGFVELDRTFRELPRNTNTEDSALESYTGEILPWFERKNWNYLLKHRLVILLGEEGSGKSWELRNQTCQLCLQGRFAFYLRLDELASQQLTSLLDEKNRDVFQAWYRGSEEATFFLDSVDEAKLRSKQDFFDALSNLSKAIGDVSIRRARLVISSRISSWSPESDERELLARFPLQTRTQTATEDGSTEVKDDSDSERVLIARICALSRDQVDQLVRARPNIDVAGFIRALDETYAWELARRPMDVADLLSYWIQKGQLDTLTDLTDFAVRSGLRRPERDQDDPLSEHDARIGAEDLAAATILCRKIDFRSDDREFVSSQGLDPTSCLPDSWKPEQVRALLHRSLFDSVSYGHIRFHHRRISEYLAASWLGRQIRAGCPLIAVENLLTCKVGTERVIRPASAAVTAWLCSIETPISREIRHWVLAAAPEIHLRFGDPQHLPGDYRSAVIRRIVERTRGQKRTWIEYEDSAIARLADPSMAMDLAEVFKSDAESIDIRILAIRMVQARRMATCLESLHNVAIREAAPSPVRAECVEAICEIAQPHEKRQLLEALLTRDRLNKEISSLLVERLYPTCIANTDLLEVIKRTCVSERVDTFEHTLRRVLKERLTPSLASELLPELITLIQGTPPLDRCDRGKAVYSLEYVWMVPAIQSTIVALLSSDSLTDLEEKHCAAAISYLADLEYATRDEELRTEIDNHSRSHPNLRRHYFWIRTSDYRAAHHSMPQQFFSVFNTFSLLTQSPGDIDFLIADISTRPDAEEKMLAMRSAFDLLHQTDNRRSHLAKIRASSRGSAELKKEYRSLMLRYRTAGIRFLYYRQIRNRLLSGWWWRRINNSCSVWKKHWKGQFWLYLHLPQLAAGKLPYALAQLSREAERGNHGSWAPKHWKDLRRRRGRIITRCARKGCQRTWRTFTPRFPEEYPASSGIDSRIVAGLSGLHADFLDGKFNLQSISPTEAKLAARYALHELNNFPNWLRPLLEIRYEPVRDLLREAITLEWEKALPTGYPLGATAKVAHGGRAICDAMADHFEYLLARDEPANPKLIHQAIQALCTSSDVRLDALSRLAASRLSSQLAPVPTTATFWCAIWIQINAESAFDAIRKLCRSSEAPAAFVTDLCAKLHREGDHSVPLLKAPSYAAPAFLAQFIPFVFEYVRPAEDIERPSGVGYTPVARDDAQHFRSRLLGLLEKSPSRETLRALRELATCPALRHLGDWIHTLIRRLSALVCDQAPWPPTAVRDFSSKYESDPRTAFDLYNIVRSRIAGEIKLQVESADISMRDEITRGSRESRLRSWLTLKLRERSRGHYTVPQEAEIDLEQRPDIRIEHPIAGYVSLEVKWAYKWTLRELLIGLETQLVGQYLRAHDSHYGVYIVGMMDNDVRKRWEDEDGHLIQFTELVEVLSARARQLAITCPNVFDLDVVGIDFRDPRRHV